MNASLVPVKSNFRMCLVSVFVSLGIFMSLSKYHKVTLSKTHCKATLNNNIIEHHSYLHKIS
jgi:hypothetical protein